MALLLSVTGCSDGGGSGSTVNQPPVAGDQSVTTAEDTPLAITLNAQDADGDILSYEILSLPAHGALTGTPPNLSYIGAVDFHGSDSFTYRARDATTASAPAIVHITVTPVNDVPAATSQDLTVAEDQIVAITLAGSDVDGDSLSFEILTQPAHGALTGTPPDVSYQGDANFNGTDSFTYRAKDASSDSAPATVELAISAVNDLPVATPQSLSVFGHDAVSIVLAGTDIDGDALSFEVVEAPTLGSLSGTPPGLSYTPALPGSDQFTFRVNDGHADSALATVSLTVSLPIARAVLAGPLGGAQVHLYHYPDLAAPVYSTTTSTDEALDRIGYFDLPRDELAPDDLHLIVVSGGSDYDADDDGVLDDAPTPNAGTLHAVVTGAQIGEELIDVTAISEIAYHRAAYLMAALFPKEQVLIELDARAALILGEDLNGDGAIDRRDLTAWDPAAGAASLRFDAGALAALTLDIGNDTAELEDFLRQSDPILGELAVPSGVKHIGMVGGYVVSVTNGASDALAVFDVSSPNHPQKVAGLSFSSSLNDAFLSGTRLYYVHSNKFIGAVDLSDPLQPGLINEIQAYPLDGFILTYKIFASGNSLYASDSQGVTRYALAPDGGIIGQVFATNAGFFGSVAIVATGDGAAAYVSSATPGFRVWDMNLPGPYVALVETGAQVISDFEVIGERLWASGTDMLMEFDISNPLAPTLLASYSGYGGRLQHLAGQHLAAMQAGDVVTLDASQPGQATEVARVRPGLMRTVDAYYLAGSVLYGFADSFTFDSAAFFVADAQHDLPRNLTSLADAGQGILDIAAEGNLVYAAQAEGVAIFGVAMDGSSVERFSRAVVSPGNDVPMRLGVLNGHAYLANLANGLLHVIDAGDPTAPTEASAVPLNVGQEVFPRDVALEGSTAYVVAIGDANFITLDVSSPSNPQILASIPLPESGSLPVPVTPVARDGYVYIADPGYGLRIVDARNPSAPQQAGSVLVPIVNDARPFDVNLEENLAYMAVSGYGLYVVDISDPAQPVTLSQTPLFRAGLRFVPDGDLGYSMSGGGIIVVDLTDPAAPRPLYAIDAPAADVEKIGNVLATRSYSAVGILPAVLQRVP